MLDHDELGFASVRAVLDAACAVPALLTSDQVEAIITDAVDGPTAAAETSPQAGGAGERRR